MKKYFFILAAMAALPLTFTACSSSDDGENNIIILSPYSEFKDEAKTLTFISLPQINESQAIKSIQLSENGRYLVRLVERAEEVKGENATRAGENEYIYVTGFYSILEKGVSYRLEGFGDITLKITGQTLHISLQLTAKYGGRTIEVGAQVTTAPQNTSQATLNICQNWNVTKTRLRLTNKNGLKLGRDFNACNLREIKRYIEENSACRVKETFDYKSVVTNIEFDGDQTFKIYYADGKDGKPATDVGSWQWGKEDAGQLKYVWEGHEMGNSFEAGNGIFEPKSESTGWLTIDAVIETNGIDYDATLTFFLSVNGDTASK